MYFFMKKDNFQAIIEGDVLQEGVKIIFVMRLPPSNKFWKGSTSLKLSKNMPGVIGNRMNPFLITEACGGGDFYMFRRRFFIFYNNCAEITWKKLSFSKQQRQCSGG